MTQSKLKRKSINWINEKLRHFGELEQDLEDFYRFECSKFFVGETRAELNKEYYYKRMSYIGRKIRQLKLLKRGKEND